MNYIIEIKAFMDLVQVKGLSTGQIALWYALMYINNKCAWQEWFTAPNITLESNTGLSRQGIVKSRNVLKQYGIIEFKTNGTNATSYRIVSNNIQDCLQDSVQAGVQVGVQDSIQSSVQNGGTLTKLNETKQNKTKFKEKITKENTHIPKLQEVIDYCGERNNNVDANKFYDYYSANGFMVGKNKMKDFKACIRTWENRENNNTRNEGYVEEKNRLKIYTESDFITW